ncbi:MAG: rhodanese-like domain-containing protein, partial [Ginsengibacter sp.]
MEKNKSIANKADNGLFTIITKALTSSKIPKINVADAAAQESSYVFLDSREKEEFDVSHIKDAIFTGASDFNYKGIQSLSKNTKIIVYCSVGVRSDQIAKKLIDAGYRDVQNLFGGIFEW